MIHVHILAIPHGPMSNSLVPRHVTPITLGCASHGPFLTFCLAHIGINTIRHTSSRAGIVARGDDASDRPVGFGFVPPDAANKAHAHAKVIKEESKVPKVL